MGEATVITCPNPSCQAVNSEDRSACQVCGAALPHRYLWGIGSGLSGLRLGSSLNHRYRLVQPQILLDTQPGLPPEAPRELPPEVVAYLHLAAYPLQVPRPYAVFTTAAGDCLLLEGSAIATTANPVALLPTLDQSWPTAPPLRQLNWLWQIAQLWQPFQAQQVAQTLLQPELLRVDDSTLRLRQLQADARPPSLAQLGQSWLALANAAHPAVAPFLQALTRALTQGLPQQPSPEQLETQLQQALEICAQGQQTVYNLAVYTDQGPSRQRNEDACYPSSGMVQQIEIASPAEPSPSLLLLVCDGIGGHQGGDVASKLAIASIQQYLEPLLSQPDRSTDLVPALEQAIAAANDQIAEQNDRFQRQARDRMGTTLVLAVVRGAYLYLAHVGDSRAYCISRQSCQQATLDDDVAAREMRLGYGLYREVLDHPGSGSLIQALGMGPATALYPTVQRFILDSDSVFLLCSDGLSDYDRVEQFWQHELLPVVVGEQTAAASAQRLVQLANTYNGHDNVTVGILQAQVTQPSAVAVPAAVAEIEAGEDSESSLSPQPTAILTAIAPSPTLRQNLRPDLRPDLRAKAFPQRFPLLLGGLVIFAIAGAAGWALWGVDRNGLPSQQFQSETADVLSTTSNSVPTPTSLETGSFARIQQSTVAAEESRSPSVLTLYASLEAAQESVSEDPPARGNLPAGGIVQILGKQSGADQQRWVRLKVCSVPTATPQASPPTESEPTPLPTPAATPAATPLADLTASPAPADLTVFQPGAEGWIRESQVAPISVSLPRIQPSQQGICRR